MRDEKGMKRKSRLALAAAITAVSLLLPTSSLQAEEPTTRSYGNLEGVETMLKLYEQDINYLHNEIGQLLSECK